MYRCKMCGGDLKIQDGATSCVCEFCGTQQTLPTNQNENLQGLFNRANVLRIKSEFDKAADIYEKILQEDQTEAEAYWGLILCKYGIEYVEDPAIYKRIPTCHRASYEAVTTDEDYKNALKYADAVQREIYETDAAKIEEIQKGIIAISQKESPYDVFICYKETDNSGNRTQDSVIANDIYYQLKNEGFKVFYAAISLEDKLGLEYEPVIFSALNTAKVMLVLGTKPEYFNAVWVKNEWSRFLKIMKKDRTRLMIPCYKDMDLYELPEEFAHLQAQNMEKIGFINDLVRGIKKVIRKDQPQPAVKPMPVAAAAPVYTSNVNALLKRGNMALEDGEWEKADDFFEQVLNQDAECAQAYFGKFLAANKQPGRNVMIDPLIDNFCGDIEKETVEAFPLDEDHIQKIIHKFSIPEYLPEKTIIDYYHFSSHYQSEVKYLKEQRFQLLTYLAADKFLIRAKKYANEKEKELFKNWMNSVENAMDHRIIQALEEDQQKEEELKKSYVFFLKEKDYQIQKLWQQASIKREQDYQKIIRDMRSAGSKGSSLKSDLYRAKMNFSTPGMKDYKEAAKYAELCKIQISRFESYERRKIEESKIENQLSEEIRHRFH